MKLLRENLVKKSVASLKVKGVSITTPTALSNQFSNHFATIGPELPSNIDSSNSNGYQTYLTSTNKRFQRHPTNTTLLNHLNKSKAAGLDKISRLIREYADLICNPIRDNFNQSISQCTFQDDWKCAKVTPLFRSGPNNYRPISGISGLAKVFKRIVCDQLYAYQEEHNIICKYQSGFRAIHSAVTALLEATDTWAYNINRGKFNAVFS